MVIQSLAWWQSGVGGTCACEHHKPVGVVCTQLLQAILHDLILVVQGALVLLVKHM